MDLLFLLVSILLPLSIIHSSLSVVFLERLRMHRLLSSAALWPTLVSDTAPLFHPLLSSYSFTFSLQTAVCQTERLMGISLLPLPSLFLISVLSLLFHIPFYRSASLLELTPLLLAIIQHVSTCLVFFGIWLHHRWRHFFLHHSLLRLPECSGY